MSSLNGRGSGRVGWEYSAMETFMQKKRPPGAAMSWKHLSLSHFMSWLCIFFPHLLLFLWETNGTCRMRVIFGDGQTWVWIQTSFTYCMSLSGFQTFLNQVKLLMSKCVSSDICEKLLGDPLNWQGFSCLPLMSPYQRPLRVNTLVAKTVLCCWAPCTLASAMGHHSRSFIQHVFIEHLLRSRYCPRCSKLKSEKNWTWFLPLWYVLSSRGERVWSNNPMNKYVITNHAYDNSGIMREHRKNLLGLGGEG